MNFFVHSFFSAAKLVFTLHFALTIKNNNQKLIFHSGAWTRQLFYWRNYKIGRKYQILHIKPASCFRNMAHRIQLHYSWTSPLKWLSLIFRMTLLFYISMTLDHYIYFTYFHRFTLDRRAMEVVMIEDRPRQASEFASRAGRLLVKLGRYVSLKVKLLKSLTVLSL